MSKKTNNCKVCGEYSAKRKVCKNCKEEQPYTASEKNSEPFQRKKKARK